MTHLATLTKTPEAHAAQAYLLQMVYSGPDVRRGRYASTDGTQTASEALAASLTAVTDVLHANGLPRLNPLSLGAPVYFSQPDIHSKAVRGILASDPIEADDLARLIASQPKNSANFGIALVDIEAHGTLFDDLISAVEQELHPCAASWQRELAAHPALPQETLQAWWARADDTLATAILENPAAPADIQLRAATSGNIRLQARLAQRDDVAPALAIILASQMADTLKMRPYDGSATTVLNRVVEIPSLDAGTLAGITDIIMSMTNVGTHVISSLINTLAGHPNLDATARRHMHSAITSSNNTNMMTACAHAVGLLMKSGDLDKKSQDDFAQYVWRMSNSGNYLAENIASLAGASLGSATATSHMFVTYLKSDCRAIAKSAARNVPARFYPDFLENASLTQLRRAFTGNPDFRAWMETHAQPRVRARCAALAKHGWDEGYDELDPATYLESADPVLRAAAAKYVTDPATLITLSQDGDAKVRAAAARVLAGALKVA